MGESTAVLVVATDLRLLLRPRRRDTGRVAVSLDGTTTLVHLVESIGIPRTEVGLLRIGERIVPRHYVPVAGESVSVEPVRRPEPGAGRGFLLDVGLGSLARRMRLLGLDVLYDTQAQDAALVDQAAATGRVLLTQDRGLLRRRALPRGALVRGSGADAQLADVIDRFDPLLAPWTRCPACNGVLQRVDRAEIAHLLEPGTRASYSQFVQCSACGKPYWRGAHAGTLARRVDRARRLAQTPADSGPRPLARPSAQEEPGGASRRGDECYE